MTKLITALRRATIPADAVGGGPLWGINGVVCKAHGRSKAPEVASTIGTAKKTVEIDLVGTFRKELAAIKSSMNIPNT
jgi:fatty acid/phospholipid biosynthesis enzyme